jgi:hypothetical protein
MAKQTKAATKRTKTEVLPKSKRELTVKEKQKVKGGIIITKTWDRARLPPDLA